MTSERTRRRMHALVRQWETSEDTRTVFARRHGLTVAKLAYWARRVRTDRRSEAVAFAPVHVVADATRPGGTAVEVTLPSGERLTVREGVSPELLRTVVSTLRASC